MELRREEERIQLAIPELFPELDALAAETAPGTSAEFPFVLSAGERRSPTASTLLRDPDWRRKDEAGALKIGVAPNELTRSEDRDWLAGTPWHRHPRARRVALSSPAESD